RASYLVLGMLTTFDLPCKAAYRWLIPAPETTRSTIEWATQKMSWLCRSKTRYTNGSSGELYQPMASTLKEPASRRTPSPSYGRVCTTIDCAGGTALVGIGRFGGMLATAISVLERRLFEALSFGIMICVALDVNGEGGIRTH